MASLSSLGLGLLKISPKARMWGSAGRRFVSSSRDIQIAYSMRSLSRAMMSSTSPGVYPLAASSALRTASGPYRSLAEEYGPDAVRDAMTRLLRSRWTARALALVLAREFIKASDLQALGAPEASAHRAIADLREMGIIEPDERVKASRGGGPRTQIWRLSSSIRLGEDTLPR